MELIKTHQTAKTESEQRVRKIVEKQLFFRLSAPTMEKMSVIYCLLYFVSFIN